jgi:uncharacterized damage-inducible protein DinB
MTQPEFLERIETDLRQLLEQLRTHIMPLSDEALQYRPSQEQWTIAECCAHLNLFTTLYLPRIEAAIHRAKARKWAARPDVQIRYTLMASGDLRKVASDDTKKRRTKKRYDTYAQGHDRTALKTHIIHLEQLLRHVAAARTVDINRAKVPRGPSGFFSYTLGNAFEWLTAHSQRHIRQMLQHEQLTH